MTFDAVALNALIGVKEHPPYKTQHNICNLGKCQHQVQRKNEGFFKGQGNLR